MFKNIFASAIIAVTMVGEIGFNEMVCLSDSSGRQVDVYGTDTSITFRNVVRVLRRSNTYFITFKNGDTLSLTRPPFTKVDAAMKSDNPDTVVNKVEEKKHEEQKKDIEKLDVPAKKRRR